MEKHPKNSRSEANISLVPSKNGERKEKTNTQGSMELCERDLNFQPSSNKFNYFLIQMITSDTHSVLLPLFDVTLESLTCEKKPQREDLPKLLHYMVIKPGTTINEEDTAEQGSSLCLTQIFKKA